MKKITITLLAIFMIASAIAYAYDKIDWSCMSDCQRRYGYGYCRSMCSY